jgi:hypothetical protein
MLINHEVKGNLARLLATEDLVVEHKKVETAQFNVHTRVLTLPTWEKASSTVYDLLVGHEVGHALYTPDRDWFKDRKIPVQFLNVVEDARIEKLMKRRYAGLAKTFYRGYSELSEQDFFCIGDDDISTYNLADRVNLYFKIGNYIDVPFVEEDKPIVKLIADCETFEDALDAAEKLYLYCKQNQQEETNVPIDNLEAQQGGADNQSSSNVSDQQEGETEQSESIESEGSASNKSSQVDTQKNPTTMGNNDNEDPDVKTMESLEESLKDLVNQSGFDNVYLQLPEVNLSSIVVSNSEIYNKVDEFWSSYYTDPNFIHIFNNVDNDYNKFKKSAQKEVNYLVKEFECRKSATSYSRSTVSKTGVLDCTKLHTYKYNEDLFKKVNVIPDGKNHGLIFILDWSGSMQDVIVDTIKQLYNLIWFCKKVNIPFDVYAFTSDWPKIKYDEDMKVLMPKLAYKKKDGIVQINEYFSLLNLFTSKTNAKTLETQMRNIYRIAYSFDRLSYTSYGVPYGLSLSGTPLNETLICLHQIIPQFKKENRLEKVQCIVLTDGEAPPLKYHREIQRRWEADPIIGTASIGSNCFLRDRKLGTTYSMDYSWEKLTDIFLTHLKDKFKDTNFIGIRVLESRDAGQFIRRYAGYYGDEYDQMSGSWKKNKSFVIKSSGYHSYFGLSANALSQDSQFSVPEVATKTQIKSAFVKSLRSKKMNKRILSEFIDLIA